MKLNYTQFRIFLHLLVAFVFLADVFVSQLPEKIYIFLKKYKDTILGCYYIYLAYEIYSTIDIQTPMSSRRNSFE